MHAPMRIGELAQATGVDTDTIRFYEKARLLPKPARSENGYRIYAQAHQGRLEFIRHCRLLGMTLDEIRTLLRIKDAPENDCEEVNALLDAHIGEVTRRMRELQQLEKQLKGLRAQCKRARAAKDCGILKELALPAGRRAA